MGDLKACAVCFNTKVKLFDMDTSQYRHVFNILSGLKTSQGCGSLNYLCVECSAYVRRYKTFRDKCQRAHYAFKELLYSSNEIKLSHIEAIDRKSIGIKQSLSYWDVNKVCYEEAEFQELKKECINIYNGSENEVVPIMHFGIHTQDNLFEVPVKRLKITNKDDNENVTAKCDDVMNICSRSLFGISDIVKKYFTDLSCNENEKEVNADNYSAMDNHLHSDSEEEYPHKGNDQKVCDEEVSGTNLDEEYANIVPITDKEAKAAAEIYKMFTPPNPKYRCEVCSKGFNTEKYLKIHLRMHDKHLSGNFVCDLCLYYYKTELLLKTHITEKHMYKYICRKCPEVCFNRTTAKQHYIFTHLQKGKKRGVTWYELRPSWLRGTTLKKVKNARPGRKVNKPPDDFLVYSPVPQEEQYKMIQDRRLTRNYLDALYKCEQCFKGYRVIATYNNHMRHHNPDIAGPLQCDMCKLYFKNANKMYHHMSGMHLFKYSCRICDFFCYNKSKANMHYKEHKNVSFPCPHCDKEFKKKSTVLTHVRLKHPSTTICGICGHSFVNDTGLYFHKKRVHTKEEMQASEAMQVDESSSLYCGECKVQFLSQGAFDTHLGSSKNHASTNLSAQSAQTVLKSERQQGPRRKRTRNREVLNNSMILATGCELCGVYLGNEVKARKHYKTEHPGAEFPKRYMCDVCGHATRQYANLMVHMRTHTKEKPYSCPHCDRRFSMPSNRDRHLVIHTGEKPFKCKLCNHCYAQRSSLKVHVQTAHLKIPYAPWSKKRKRNKRVKAPPATAITGDTLMQSQQKLVFETQPEDYLGAYIAYHE